MSTAEEKLARIRALCKTDSDGGAAAYVRLASDDPMDYDPHAKPMLAVAVADIERVLDGPDDPPRAVLVFHDEAIQVHRGDAREVAERLKRRADAGRKPEIFDPKQTGIGGIIAAAMIDPDRFDGTIYREERPDRPAILTATDQPNPVTLLVEAVLATLDEPATAADLHRLVAPVVLGAELTLAEVRAALGTLHATGQAAMVAARGGGPRYVTTAGVPRLERNPLLLQPVLSVLAGEHIFDAGTDGIIAADLADQLRRTYRFPRGIEPGVVQVASAAGALVTTGLAVRTERGRYIASSSTKGQPR